MTEIDDAIKHFNTVVNDLLKKNKYLFFVRHIQRHLGLNEEVICKICSKSVDECAKEERDYIIATINANLLEQSKGIQVEEDDTYEEFYETNYTEDDLAAEYEDEE